MRSLERRTPKHRPTLLVVAVCAALAFGAAEPAPGAVSCPETTGSSAAAGQADKPVEPPVVLTPEANSQVRVVNFAGGRARKTPLFHVKAEPALPAGMEARLRLSADQLVRTGNDKVETVDFPDLTFTALDVSPNRKRVSFRVCLSPAAKQPAGRYTGIVSLDGPPGVETASVSLTANAKNRTLFAAGLILTLVLAYLVLLYKAAAESRAVTIEKAKGKGDQAEKDAAKWGPAFWGELADVGFQVRSVLTLGVTLGALYALWENNPGWGDAGVVPSLLTLVGAGLAAVGARAILNPSTKKSDA